LQLCPLRLILLHHLWSFALEQYLLIQQGLIDRLGLKDDVEFSTYCLDKISLALVPGSAFGAPGYVRLSFATSMDNLKLAIERLSNI